MGNAIEKDMNKDIQEFGVQKVFGHRLVPCPEIQSTKDYNHGFINLHHFIKDTHYKRNRSWYEARGIKQKLIAMTNVMHQHLEYPDFKLSEEDFLRVYRIPRHLLIFDKDKWLENEAQTAQYLKEFSAQNYH